MPNPTITFAFVAATLMGAVFHLLVGGDFRRLALYLLCGWFGFALGHFLGSVLDINSFNIGSLRFFPAIMGGVIALIVAYSLSSGRSRRSVRR